jgi:RNA polymerase sigma factor (sigma-70 family)
MYEHEPTKARPIRAPSLPPAPLDTDTSSTDEAFVMFYRDTIKPLIAFLIVQGASLSDAAEVAQDTLGSAYQRWNTLDNPRAWSYRVASRAWARKHFSVKEEDLTADPPEPSPVLRTTEIDRWEREYDAVHAISTLPPRQRQVMAWTLYGYTPSEIAQELGMNTDAVRSSLHKARRALITRLSRTETAE